jgi:diketogulonate reductase-like aldo/keto reductase
VAAIPKAANVDVFDFELTDEEMRRIFDLQGGLPARLRDQLGL